MTRILDIDLDIFVTPICHFAESGRLGDDYQVADMGTVIRFLEIDCGLSAVNPKPGAVFEEHDELFGAIKELIATGTIQTPFDLVHVDAHADMACGQWGPIEYLLRDLMHKPVEERLDPVGGSPGLNQGSVILFLAAAEWMKSLTYVHHPNDGNDFAEYFLDYVPTRSDLGGTADYEEPPDAGTLYFHVPKFKDAGVLIDRMQITPKLIKDHCETGKRIPFTITPVDSFHEPGFDFVFATRSPGFTPPAADNVFDRIRAYIDLVL